MIYLYLFGTCFHFIYVFMIIGNYCMLGTVEQPNPVIMNIFSLQDLKSEKTFTGWDFDVKWEIPSNETDSFPIPKKSEMQFDKPNL